MTPSLTELVVRVIVMLGVVLVTIIVWLHKSESRRRKRAQAGNKQTFQDNRPHLVDIPTTEWVLPKETSDRQRLIQKEDPNLAQHNDYEPSNKEQKYQQKIIDIYTRPLSDTVEKGTVHAVSDTMKPVELPGKHTWSPYINRNGRLLVECITVDGMAGVYYVNTYSHPLDVSFDTLFFLPVAELVQYNAKFMKEYQGEQHRNQQIRNLLNDGPTQTKCKHFIVGDKILTDNSLWDIVYFQVFGPQGQKVEKLEMSTYYVVPPSALLLESSTRIRGSEFAATDELTIVGFVKDIDKKILIVCSHKSTETAEVMYLWVPLATCLYVSPAPKRTKKTPPVVAATAEKEGDQK